MSVTSRRLVDSILVLPNAKIVFGHDAANVPLGVVATFRFGDLADVRLTELGAIGLTFLDGGDLASVEQLDFMATGAIPGYVTQRRDEIIALQGRRLVFANFVAAALFGRIAAAQHTSLDGALNAGMSDMLAFRVEERQLSVEPTPFAPAVLGPKLAAVKQGSKEIRVVPAANLESATAFTARLAARAADFTQAGLQVCMAMNYQAAILHNAQHAPASFAINFSVAEALVDEILLSYGIVGAKGAKAFATKPHSVTAMSNNAFRSAALERKLTALEDGKLIDSYLGGRLRDARRLRNDLMHAAMPVAITDSGPLQTAVRDLWSLLLDEPFELTASYTMRW